MYKSKISFYENSTKIDFFKNPSKLFREKRHELRKNPDITLQMRS